MDDGSFEAFGHLFSAQMTPWKADLESLAAESATYEEFFLDETDGGPGLYRVRYQPAEVHRFVRGLVGWDEFLANGFENVSDRPLAREAEAAAKVRQASGELGEGEACPADFLGDEVEAISCGHRPDRYEKLRPAGTPVQATAVLHEVATSLPIALRGCPKLTVESEDDFQRLLFLVLRSIFDDTRREEWTPSVAGNAKRVDLAVPSASLLIEAKFVRSRSHARKIADELRVDIESYHSHPACESIFALVWDSAHYIDDPVHIERDLSAPRVKGAKGFDVVVRVVR